MLSILYYNWITMGILKFFDTAPKTKSKIVTDLEKAGKLSLLVEAVEAERKLKTKGSQEQSSDEQVGRTGITVKRVGEHY